MGTKQGGQTVTPPFPVRVFSFFPNSPPLSSVNRITIRLPPRISVTLENSHRIKHSLFGQGGNLGESEQSRKPVVIHEVPDVC